LAVLAVVVAAGVGVNAHIFQQRREIAAEFQGQVEQARANAEEIRKQTVLPQTEKLPRGENFSAALQQFGLSSQEAEEVAIAAGHAFNLRQLRAGHTLVVARTAEGELREINYKIDADRMLHIVPATDGFSAQVKEIPSRLEVAVVHGQLDDSLFNAVEKAGESPGTGIAVGADFCV
jgi:hypothetical protein